MWRYKTKDQTQLQVQNQRQMVDQNYANEILFMTMSSLESLKQKIEGYRKPK